MCKDDQDLGGLLVQATSSSSGAEHFQMLQRVSLNVRPKSDLRIPGVAEQELCRVD